MSAFRTAATVLATAAALTACDATMQKKPEAQNAGTPTAAAPAAQPASSAFDELTAAATARAAEARASAEKARADASALLNPKVTVNGDEYTVETKYYNGNLVTGYKSGTLTATVGDKKFTFDATCMPGENKGGSLVVTTTKTVDGPYSYKDATKQLTDKTGKPVTKVEGFCNDDNTVSRLALLKTYGELVNAVAKAPAATTAPAKKPEGKKAPTKPAPRTTPNAGQTLKAG